MIITADTSIYTIASVINSILFIVASILIYKNKGDNGKTGFKDLSSFIFCLGAVYLSYSLIQIFPSLNAAFLIKSIIFWSLTMIFFYLRFSLSMLDILQNFKLSYYFFAAVTILIQAANFFGLIINGAEISSDKQIIMDGGVFLYPFVVFFLLTIAYSNIQLIINYRNSSPYLKQQIKYVLMITITALFVNLPDILRWFGYDFPPLGNIFTGIFILMIIYSMLSHRLPDIKLILKKPTIYAISLAALFIEVLFAKLSVNIYFPRDEFWLDFAILLAALISYPRIKKTIYGISHKYFFSSVYEPAKVIESFSERLNSTFDPKNIYNCIHEVFSNTFYAKGSMIMLHDKSSFSLVFKKDIFNAKRSFKIFSQLLKIINNTNFPILTEEIKHQLADSKDKNIFLKDIEENKIDLIVPMKLKNKLIGLVILGRKTSEEIYNDDDLKLIKALAEHAALSIENARLYGKIDDFNKTLQQKVNNQTKKLRETAEHLKKLMQMRSEFLDIASHQLRTPVSVIKGVLSMIEENSVPENKKKEFINGALEKSIKLGEIINDILRASEMDSEKFVLRNKSANLTDLLTKIKEDKERSATINKVRLNINLPDKQLPEVMADNRYLEHAIINLINNAIQYTPNGTVNVNVASIGNKIIVKIEDTGIGIPKENLSKLFQKFSRAQNAVEAYADGSGLGLFIVKQIVDAIPGAKIEIEKTELNKGTTFALTLPIAKKPILERSNMQNAVIKK